MLIISLLFFYGVSCRREVDLALDIDFSYEVLNSNFSVPVQINIVNNTTGAQFYKWTFEGGLPETSTKKEPGTVTFHKAGPIVVKLEAWNDELHEEKEIIIHLDSAVRARFEANADTADFGPTGFVLTNTSEGATRFNWTFEGGMPATAAGQNPGPVRFQNPGTYRIHLQASNDRGVTDTVSRWVTVRPSLSADFTIEPSFEDDDFEAPLVAVLHNQTTSATAHKWSATGGVLSSTTDSVPSVRFSEPGTYTVRYEATNSKQTQMVDRTITVKPNSGLRTFTGVKLGINTAKATIGCFFSTSLRRVLKSSEVNSTNGSKIDLVFFGLNENFSFNRFVRPDRAQDWTFAAIPGGTRTDWINKQEATPYGEQLSSSGFDSLSNGSALDGFPIPGDVADAAFDQTVVPRVVLFRNAEGKKGAVKIRAFVPAGAESYILCDIKVQKE